VPESVVTVRGVTKRYGSFTALDAVDLDVPEGEVFALLGPNGAGKTTLISIVAGLVRATAGEARVLGRDVVRDYRFTRRAVGLVPQELNFDPFFTVEETLRFQAGYFDVRLTEERLEEILGALDLTAKRHANTRSLSGGMKRRLLIGKALVHAPRVLFLDEPTAGVDVQLRQQLWAYVRTLVARGTTIVLTTHYLEEAEELADRVAVIDRGRVLVVEEKGRLLDRLAGRTLRVTLAAPLAEVPRALAELGARSEEEGRVLSLSVPPGGSFGAALAALGRAGLELRDVETRRMRLEEIFVSLLEAGARGGRP
jgi:ABC-2 type transport system ATP-binding protein